MNSSGRAGRIERGQILVKRGWQTAANAGKHAIGNLGLAEPNGEGRERLEVTFG